MGASHYEWNVPDKEESSESKNFTRKVVAEHGVINPKSSTEGFGGFRKCLLNEKETSLEAREKLWSSVFFYNLLQVPMVKSKMTSVKDGGGAQAWEVFKKIVPILKPQICIVWGVKILDDWGKKKKYVEFNNTYISKKEESGIYSRNGLITIDGN